MKSLSFTKAFQSKPNDTEPQSGKAVLVSPSERQPIELQRAPRLRLRPEQDPPPSWKRTILHLSRYLRRPRVQPPPAQLSSFLTKLPLEIRQIIYKFALDDNAIDLDRAQPDSRLPAHVHDATATYYRRSAHDTTLPQLRPSALALLRQLTDSCRSLTYTVPRLPLRTARFQLLGHIPRPSHSTKLVPYLPATAHGNPTATLGIDSGGLQGMEPALEGH